MQYNTQQKKMALPEYGRSVQNMVDYAVTIEDRAERQWCAETIVHIMEGMFPNLKNIPDFEHKLWDHLAIMSDFKLDIDYPFEVVKPESLELKPDPIPENTKRMKYRHYGRLLENLIAKACEFEDGMEKDNLVALICNHMRKDYITWNKDSIDENKIADDLYELSEGKLHLTDEILDLMAERIEKNYRSKLPVQRNNTSQKQNMKNNKKR
ncbi:MAG: DUF4290 domain-containing protein [Bacteroidaceae bacterium]|nr:DUF4290 domain-containing protein [Bacteroidaceae bacterium]MBR1541391.1 DUF4290 domain-containing protein [Bacteroidaceae bacterium]